MKCKIDVSVIIPVDNSEKYIADILDDLIKQTYENFEVIVINDGSQDGSQKILEEYEKKDDRIRVLEVMNAGVSKARNLGINHRCLTHRFDNRCQFFLASLDNTTLALGRHLYRICPGSL